MEMMHIGSAAAFDKLVQSSEKPVLVDFWATWCGPCRMLAPVIEDLAAEHPEIQFAKLDVDQVPDVAMRFGVSAIPTVVLFKAAWNLRVPTKRPLLFYNRKEDAA